MTFARVIAAAGTVLVLAAAPAQAHAERSASTPREGERVAAAPQSLRVTFTEPPTGDAAVEVVDGCGRNVVTGVAVQNFEITATLAEGQPGRWTVNTNVISAVDAHNTRDGWTFTVRGEADCSQEPSPADEAAGDEDDDGRSAVPLIAIGAATLALISLALVLRGRGKAEP